MRTTPMHLVIFTPTASFKGLLTSEMLHHNSVQGQPTSMNRLAFCACNLSRLVNLTINGEISKAEEASLLDKLCLQISKPTNENIRTHLQAAHYLACIAQKDMSWKEVLNSKDRDLALAALDKELSSLEKTILTRIKPDDPEYATAIAKATSGRLLLDVKRSGLYKCRGVKQGFKENLTSI